MQTGGLSSPSLSSVTPTSLKGLTRAKDGATVEGMSGSDRRMLSASSMTMDGACLLLVVAAKETIPTPGQEARCFPTSVTSTPTPTFIWVRRTRRVRENGHISHVTPCKKRSSSMRSSPLAKRYARLRSL
eukprot:CAMPEP_0114147766 /NCGR_PEP_ID=MMETSP0043_2-20121206/21278_1 /TAXON_ID=464988 /ORGANISM="Hemiselmis andersenii, Strain CCMP644" /LENGTH=129 /DNA_ID=CAMNT_0001242319 /DNA_START=584 /DNA_END=973 /DNA_ORIENTATION=-